MKCDCASRRGDCGCCRDDRCGGEPPGAETIAQDLVELEQRLERDMQAVREQLGHGQETA
jgi:hypothetical protein